MPNGDILKTAISDIQAGKLEIGQPLSQRKLGEIYGCGRTVAKRVLDQLLSAGYVEHTPGYNDGNYIVTGSTMETLAQAVELRVMLETYAISKLARVITTPMIKRLKALNTEMIEAALSDDLDKAVEVNRVFHMFMVEAVDHGPLKLQLDLIYSNEAFRTFTRDTDGEGVFKAGCEHALIIDCLETSNQFRAVQAIRCHILDNMPEMDKLYANMVA